MKNERHNEIIRIIKENEVSTHEQIIDELKKIGINVTQATVSRDIKALRLIKVPSANGSVYAVSEESNTMSAGMFNNSIISVTTALHTIVVKTYPGMAGGIGVTIDSMFERHMLGSIAGDDTLLIITVNEEKAQELTEKIRNAFDCRGE